MKTIKTQRQYEPPQAKVIRDSNKRIADAIKTLSAHNRGQNVLAGLKAFLKNSGANGLDMSGQSALVCLVREFTFGSRRDFLHGTSEVVPTPKPRTTRADHNPEDIAGVY